MTLIIIALVAIVLLLIVIRLGSKSSSLSSDARPSRDRRSGQDRRTMSVRVPFERRLEHRRMEDAATNYVNELVKADSA
jgi:hypothetical protein